MINAHIDCNLTLGRYVFEASFWLRDWRLAAETHSNGAIKVLQIGPICMSLTNMKKLRELYISGEIYPVFPEDITEL
jgi:hypothetical protein